MYSPITKFHVVDQLAAAGAIVALLLSVQCYGQVFVCDRLPNTDEISAPVAQLESRKSVDMATPPSAFNITFNRPEHFTCLAVRGLNQYSSVVVALNYTTQLSNRNYIVQFELRCNGSGQFSLNEQNNIRQNVVGEVFNLPTSTSCSNCFLFFPTINRRRRQELSDGCVDCPSRCSSIGAGHCLDPPASIDCCPFFEPNGTCTTNCSATNFAPNNQTFVCECSMSCPIGHSPNAECTACVPTHVCLTDNPCQNGATCRTNSRNNSDYTCLCVGGYSGQNCQACDVVCGAGEIPVKNCSCALINICLRDTPCENGQICVLGNSSTEFMCLSQVTAVETIPNWVIAAMTALILLLILCAVGFLIELIVSNYRISRLRKKINDPMTMEEVIEMRDAGQMDMDDNTYEDTIAVPPQKAAAQQNDSNTLDNSDEEESDHEYGNVTILSDNQSPHREAEDDCLQQDSCDQVYDQPFMNNTEASATPTPQLVLSRAKTSSLPSDINSKKDARPTYVNLLPADAETTRDGNLQARSCEQLDFERARSHTEPDYLTLLDEQPKSSNSLPTSHSCSFLSAKTSEGATNQQHLTDGLKPDTSKRPASIVLSPNPSYEPNHQFHQSFQDRKPKTAPKPRHFKAQKHKNTKAVNRGALKFFSTKTPSSKVPQTTNPSTSHTWGKPIAYSINTNVPTAKSPSYDNLEVISTRHRAASHHSDNNLTDEEEIELTRNPSYESSEVVNFYRPVEQNVARVLSSEENDEIYV